MTSLPINSHHTKLHTKKDKEKNVDANYCRMNSFTSLVANPMKGILAKVSTESAWNIKTFFYNTLNILADDRSFCCQKSGSVKRDGKA